MRRKYKDIRNFPGKAQELTEAEFNSGQNSQKIHKNTTYFSLLRRNGLHFLIGHQPPIFDTKTAIPREGGFFGVFLNRTIG
jgi:hypothetical protein